ncbi:hypothetical protein N7507_010290 [Penicillium longicatenatum]|nr:hypothetical protein N7507_010290 [Penicillium longicatenatum]
MSGAEVIAVVACVAAIVSAYRDGSELYRAIKKKWDRRHPKEEVSSNDLERSLARGQDEILAHWNAHVSRLGQRYEEGDTISREQMKDIVITLQGMLLTHLSRAVDQRVSLDVVAVLSASDYGRSCTISVLHELYQRIAQSAPVPWPIGVGSVYATVDPTSSIGYYIQLLERGRSLSWTRESSRPDGFVVTPPTGFFGQLSGSPTEMLGSSRPGEPCSPPQRERKSSGLGTAISSLWSHRSKRGSGSRASNGSSVASTADLEYLARSGVPVPQCSNSKMTLTEPATDIKPQPQQTSKCKERRSRSEKEEITRRMTRKLMRNPWTNDGRSDCGTDSDSDMSDETISPTEEVPSQPAKPEDPNPATSEIVNETPLGVQPAAPSVMSDDTTHSTALTVLPSTLSTGQFWPPRRENGYSGFCKGAWKLSSGLGGFKIYSEPIGYYLLMSKWRCYRCFFGMPLAPGSKRHDLRFDQKIYLHEATGIRYRWSFLAKSHLAYTRPGVSAPTHVHGTFGCIFCCAELDVVAPTLNSLDEFMAHLGEQHRSVDLALLERTRCVVGRDASAEEAFDINIPPGRASTSE